MTSTGKDIGSQGEDLAVSYLMRRKYKILCRNYRCRFGEIDIIACRKKIIAFIEVKTRRSATFGSPQEAIHRAKQRTIVRVAMRYMQEHRIQDAHARFDVIAVRHTQNGSSIEHITEAFDLTDIGYSSDICA
jgi:putative endonuclease